MQGGISTTSGKPPPQALSFRLCYRHWTELPFTQNTFSAKVGAGAGWRKVCACARARACFREVGDIARPSRRTGEGGEFRKSVSVTAQPPYRWLILKRKRKQAGNESLPPPRQLPPSALSLGARAENRACTREASSSPRSGSAPGGQERAGGWRRSAQSPAAPLTHETSLQLKPLRRLVHSQVEAPA